MPCTFHQSGKLVFFPRRKKRELTDKELQNLEKRTQKRKYKIDNRVADLIANSAANIWNMKKRNEYINFGTLTFPVFCDEKTGNQIFKAWVKDLRRFENVRAYIAVKEFHNSGSVHYHIIFLSKFIQYTKINEYANKQFRKKDFPESQNAFTTGSGSGSNIVRDVIGCVRYVTKYISKCNKSDFSYTEKCYFISDTCRKDKIALSIEQQDVILNTFVHKKMYKYEHVNVLVYDKPFEFDIEKI